MSSTISASNTRPVMFTTTWCGYCARLKSQLARAGVGYDEVDIETNADAAVLVAQINQGNLTVPTVLFGDGTALTNPSVRQVSGKLAELS
jgi:mycoredoxin